MANIDMTKCQDTTYGGLAGGGSGGPMRGGGLGNAWGECLRCGKWHLAGPGNCERDRRQLSSVVEAPSADREHLSERKTAYEGSATRSEKAERYDLVPPESIDAIARRIGLGVPKHGENNWRGGGVEFIKATINHLHAHLSALLKGDESDSHLDAVTCNAAFLCWF